MIILVRVPAGNWITFQHGNLRYLDEETFYKGVSMLPENWVLLLWGVKPKDTTKPKTGRMKNLL